MEGPLAVITSAHCQLMARYNEWMNRRLYALCAELPDAELQRDRGAFFKSIYLTLNHIAYGDLAFLSRLTGTPASVPELGADLFGSFAALRREREALDARLLLWTASLTPPWLADALTKVVLNAARRAETLLARYEAEAFMLTA